MSDELETVTKAERVTKSRMRRIVFWGSGAMILFIVTSLVSIEVTSRSSFCGTTCHIMETYHASWIDSAHRNVECIECHISPGLESYLSAKVNGLGQVVSDVLDRQGTKPSASVSDFSCTRSGCHTLEELAEADAEVGKPFLFNHQKHLDLPSDGLTVHCTTCHSHVRGAKHFEVNTNVCVTCHLTADSEREETPLYASGYAGEKPVNLHAPSECVTCHKPPEKAYVFHGLVIDHTQFLAQGAECQSCHRGVTAEPQRIGDTVCFSCHDYGLDRMSDVHEIHHVHTNGKHKVECFSCHGMTPHGLEAQSAGMEAFDCRKCHTDQHQTQRGIYLRGVDEKAVSPMFLTHVDCNGCHIEPSPIRHNPASGATVARATPAACDACHNEGFGERTVGLWQRATRDSHAKALALLPEAGAAWINGQPEVASLVEQARTLLEIVRVDGSWGVHNPDYTQQLIEEARVHLIEARRLAAEAGEVVGQ